MAELTFVVDPTFPMTVAVPVPGKKPVDTEFTFIGRNGEELQAYLDGSRGKEDLDALMDTIVGWGIKNRPFEREEVAKFILVYPAAARAIISKYITEISGIKLGN